ncbi:mRNA export factor GLE1 [Bacillus rossius redtenbacheri]|uniref:mRNA export factor GLE1 n=1 Tax=Bacillus rossius redtenbacheri TaxID=93214 RepID=UPI002FDD807E
MQGDRIRRYEQSVLRKAAALSGLVTGVTIGPGCDRGAGGEEPPGEEPPCPGSGGAWPRTPGPSLRGGGDTGPQYANMCVQKLLSDIELERQRHVQALAKRRARRALELERGQREFLELQLEVRRGKGEARRREEQRAMLRQAEQEEVQTRESQARLREQHQQRINERNQKIREAEDKEHQRLLDKKLRLDELHQQQCRYRAVYQQILEVAKRCRDKPALSGKLAGHTGQLRSLNEAMDHLVRHCQVSEVTEADVSAGCELVRQISTIQQFIQGIADEINAKEEAADVQKEEEASRRKQEADRKKDQAEQEKRSKAAESSQREAASSYDSVLLKSVAPEDWQRYRDLSQLLDQLHGSYADLLRDPSLKEFRFECQRAVNVPLNSISDVSASHLQDKFQKLSSLLSGRPVQLAGSVLHPGRHPQGVAYCQGVMIEKLVQLGEMTAKQPKTVFPLAAIVVALWADFPEFGRLLLAQMYRKCPYLVPMFPLQLESESDRDYYKKLGYNYSDGGEVESQENFLKRMSGITRLYAAVVATPVRRRQGKPHPHGLREGWRWLAALLNLDPRPDISATVLYELLEVAGGALHAAYGRQFSKLLHLVCDLHLRKIQEISPASCSGPRVRLETFLQNVVSQKRIPPPAGMLPPNFW